MADNGDFSFANGEVAQSAVGRNGLARIQTQKRENGICHDDSTPPVKAQTLHELHSLQKKRSNPTTPIKGAQGAFAPSFVSDEERQMQQLQSISASLASLTRETDPKVVKGDPAKGVPTPKVEHHHLTKKLAF